MFVLMLNVYVQPAVSSSVGDAPAIPATIHENVDGSG